jgi:hypothetical protein
VSRTGGEDFPATERDTAAMPKRYAARTGQTAVSYRIIIRGAIGQPLVGPLEGMSVEAAGEESVLVGDIVDQAQLQGVISWLSDLGIEIVSINPLGGPE